MSPHGMAVRTDVAPSHPAVVNTIPVGAVVVMGINLGWSASLMLNQWWRRWWWVGSLSLGSLARLAGRLFRHPIDLFERGDCFFFFFAGRQRRHSWKTDQWLAICQTRNSSKMPLSRWSITIHPPEIRLVYGMPRLARIGNLSAVLRYTTTPHVLLESRAGRSQPVFCNLYPSPRSVIKYWGFLGSLSILCLIRHIRLSIAWSVTPSSTWYTSSKMSSLLLMSPSAS
jgi:hypothetical protein